jgi:hypothetical protein
MPIVFVHGVGTRGGERYEKIVRKRESFIRNAFLHPLGEYREHASITFPYWGDLATESFFPDEIVPAGRYEYLGEQPSVSLEQTDGSQLIELVKHLGLSDTLDLLCATAADVEVSQIKAISNFGRDAIAWSDSLTEQEQQAWLAQFQSDDVMLMELAKLCHHQQEEKSEVLGSSGWFPNQIIKVIEKAKSNLDGRFTIDLCGAMNITVVGPLRRLFQKQIGFVLGDAFIYFGSNEPKTGKHAAVVSRISDAINRADAARTTEDDRLILVGHSMGGNILCDVLTSQLKDCKVECLITVGSQIPIFFHLGLLNGLKNAAGAIQRPSCVARWLNVFDRNDPLGFSIPNAPSDIEEYEYRTRTLWGTHSAYFEQVSFYERLSRRVFLS